MSLSLKKSDFAVEKIKFNTLGKIILVLEDGRELIVPLKYFPELKKLPLEKRKKYTIVDDRIILFNFSDSVYHIEDFFGLEGNWKKR